MIMSINFKQITFFVVALYLVDYQRVMLPVFYRLETRSLQPWNSDFQACKLPESSILSSSLQYG